MDDTKQRKTGLGSTADKIATSVLPQRKKLKKEDRCVGQYRMSAPPQMMIIKEKIWVEI